MLSIRNYGMEYLKGKRVIDGLNLSVREGDIYAFVGRNGAGKTTTIKAIMGILDFDSGDILINGKSIKEDPIGCKMEMAYVPDNPDL